MFKELLRTFLAGALSSLAFTFGAVRIVALLPALPFGLSNAIVFGVLVLVFDYILENVVRL